MQTINPADEARLHGSKPFGVREAKHRGIEMTATTEHVSLLQSTPEYARQEWEQFGADAVLAISMSDLSGLVADALRRELGDAADLDYTELGIEVASFVAGRMGVV